MADWTEVGEITLLQIQTEEMTGQGGYDSSLLIPVEILRLTPDGAFGLVDGAWIADRHHRYHPAARYWHASETLSFGFTSHYAHMWDVFRETQLGAGGENAIVVTDRMIELDDISGGLRIESADERIELFEPEVAQPCVEFTRFMTARPQASARELKSQREKLGRGVRGFVVGVDSPGAFDVRPGDTLSARTV